MPCECCACNNAYAHFGRIETILLLLKKWRLSRDNNSSIKIKKWTKRMKNIHDFKLEWILSIREKMQQIVIKKRRMKLNVHDSFCTPHSLMLICFASQYCSIFLKPAFLCVYMCLRWTLLNAKRCDMSFGCLSWMRILLLNLAEKRNRKIIPLFIMHDRNRIG